MNAHSRILHRCSLSFVSTSPATPTFLSSSPSSVLNTLKSGAVLEADSWPDGVDAECPSVDAMRSVRRAMRSASVVVRGTRESQVGGSANAQFEADRVT